jgi:hypothetical protein
LAPESISKSAMVIMSCQLLFIDFLSSFCHFFGLPYHFIYKKKTFRVIQELHRMDLIGYWDRFFGVLSNFRQSVKKFSEDQLEHIG